MRSMPYRLVAVIIIVALLAWLGIVLLSASPEKTPGGGPTAREHTEGPSPTAAQPPVGASVVASAPSTAQDATPGPSASPPTSASSPVDPLGARELQRIGRTPEIDPHAPGVASVIEAQRSGTHPERLSLAFAPAPFDAAAFDANPAAYVSLVEPGRVWQTKAPGEAVPVLGAVSPLMQHIEQGGQVELAVQAVPRAPVSFTSLDLGTFVENTQVAITVRADDQGIARVHLKAGAGTSGEISTLAGSPMASGQLRFVVMVALPAPTAGKGQK